MLTIIEQLQVDAANPAVPVGTLLRRAKIAASKLDLGKFEKWMEQELGGYTEKLPNYRITRGQVRGWNPHNGWIPISGDPSIIDVISRVEINESVGQIEMLLNSSDGGFAKLPFDAHKTAALNTMMPVQLPCYEVTIGIGVLTGILEEVRNKILDWSLGLEKAGVLGGTFSFSSEDKAKAQEASHMTLNVGSIGSLVGNLGSNNKSGDISTSTVNADQVIHLADTIREHIDELESAGADKTSLILASNKLDKVAKKKPIDISVTEGILTDIRNALSGAAGSLAASGILEALGRIFS